MSSSSSSSESSESSLSSGISEPSSLSSESSLSSGLSDPSSVSSHGYSDASSASSPSSDSSSSSESSASSQSSCTCECWLEPLPSDNVSNPPLLKDGMICANAQDEYKKTRWKVHVEGDETIAVWVDYGPVTINGQQSGLSDGDEVVVEYDESAGEDGVPSNGQYMLYYNCDNCPKSSPEAAYGYVFALVLDDTEPVSPVGNSREFRNFNGTDATSVEYNVGFQSEFPKTYLGGTPNTNGFKIVFSAKWDPLPFAQDYEDKAKGVVEKSYRIVARPQVYTESVRFTLETKVEFYGKNNPLIGDLKAFTPGILPPPFNGVPGSASLIFHGEIALSGDISADNPEKVGNNYVCRTGSGVWNSIQQIWMANQPVHWVQWKSTDKVGCEVDKWWKFTFTGELAVSVTRNVCGAYGSLTASGWDTQLGSFQLYKPSR